MKDFCGTMQIAVLTRPVVDHANLPGRWDFKLSWTPDEGQFSGFGMKLPSDDQPGAQPSSFTAIQNQIGLKLASLKIPVDVMLVDHLQRPTGN